MYIAVLESEPIETNVSLREQSAVHMFCQTDQCTNRSTAQTVKS
jgi:hypothetical protein